MPQLLDRPEFRDNPSRLENRDALNNELEGWIGDRYLDDIMEQLIPAGGVVGPVYDVKQIMEDPHYHARNDIVELDDPDLGKTKLLGIVPKFSDTPGKVEHTGPSLGEHNYVIYGSWLDMGEDQISDLIKKGVF